jgi:hypothetical protein
MFATNIDSIRSLREKFKRPSNRARKRRNDAMP